MTGEHTRVSVTTANGSLYPEYSRITDFPRGTLHRLLCLGYSFDSRCAVHWEQSWREFDDFFYDNPKIADSCGFYTVLDGKAAGFVSWDPRKLPESAEIGHNCVAAEFKGLGLGTAQMREALSRLTAAGAEKVIVTTSGFLTPAQRMYERAGFKLLGRRENNGSDAFSGDYIDYIFIPRKD